MADDMERFEALKKKVDSLKVRKIASENEVKRLSGEFEQCKAGIREKYGVEVEDLAGAIETMKKEREAKMRELEELVSEAEQKIGGVA